MAKLVAERYATDIDASTVLPGWSMAKSVTATLVGLLVERGRLDIHQPGIVPEWRSGTDGRELVTLDHLLRMTSGLDVVEDQSGADPNSRMLFVEPDAAAYAASRGIKHPPGTHWEYMSGSTVLACRADFRSRRRHVGKQPAVLSRSFYEAARCFQLCSGNGRGWVHSLAHPMRWQPLTIGQSSANSISMMVSGKERRLLPEGWREYVTRHTPESGANSYGAGFWTVEHSNLDYLPQDTFYANGFQGQYVIVIPSRSLVIVRLGASLGPDGIWQLLEDLISARH